MSPATSNLIHSRLPVGSNTEMVSSDYFTTPSNFGTSLPRPPADWVNQISWISASYEAVLTTLPTSQENNYAFSISNCVAQTQQLVSNFDQYCIEEACITFLAAPSNTTANVQAVPLYTAIDYDNSTNNGLPFILSLSSCALCTLTPTTSIVRWCRPAVETGTSNGTALVAGGVNRSWIDSAFLSVPHYGFRTFLEQSFANLRISVIITLIIGLKNST
jgi:hypothetical protein